MKLEKLTKLTEAFARVRTTSVFLALCFFFMWLFQVEIKRILELRFLNEDPISTTIDNDVLIDGLLLEAMEVAGADRAYIFRFHNGVRYYNGSHKNKMSCDYEVARPGTSLEAKGLQDIPVTLFPYFIKQVMINRMVYPDVSKIQDVRTRLTLERQGVKGIICMPYYRDDVLTAIIGVDYVHSQFPECDNVEMNSLLFNMEGVFNNIGDLLL